MKILFIAPELPPFIGGMESHGIEFCNWLHMKKKKYIVLTLNPDEVEFENLHKDGSLIETHDIKKILNGEIDHDLFEIQNIIFAFKPNLIFFNSIGYLEILKTLEISKKTKVFVRSGGNDLAGGWLGILPVEKHSQSLEERKKNIKETVNRYISYLVVNSEYSLSVATMMGIDERKIVKIVGGVDTKRFYPSQLKKKQMLFVGRFVKFKGVDKIVEVFYESKLFMKGWNLLLVGFGPMSNKIKEKILNLDMNEHIQIVDGVPYDKIHSYFNNSQIFLHLPIYQKKVEENEIWYHTETMGRALCEALASGLAVFSHDVGGVSEVVDKAGIVTMISSIREYSEELKRLANDENVLRKLQLLSRKRAVEKFDWEVVFRKYMELLE